MNTKVIAMYLPQYHQIPENDHFWGEGFTDWDTVKNASPLFPGHVQPHVPLDNNYYDLSLKENIRWQAKLAKQHGIYGFGIYHYWFNNEKNLLTKPADIIRDNQDIDINYLFAWDNGNWKRSWSNVSGNAWSPLLDKGNMKNGPEILIPYVLGNENDWRIHYDTIKSHFKDIRYIKVNNCPVFVIFNYSEGIHEMCEYWDSLAKIDGYNGMFFIFRNSGRTVVKKHELSGKCLHVFNYEPQTSGWTKPLSLFQVIKRKLYSVIGIPLLPSSYQIYDYDLVWNYLLSNAKSLYSTERFFHGAFVTYDDTPRRGVYGGKLIVGASPEKLSKYLRELINICRQQDKEFLFLTAWNEWGEGAYLEPDTLNHYDYLKAVAIAIQES